MKTSMYFPALLMSILFITSCSEISDIETLPTDDVKIETRQWVLDFIPFDPCEGAVSIYVEPCFNGTGYEDAIPASLDAISSASSIEFVIVNDPNADLVFQCIQGGCCGCGSAFFPIDDGNIGGPINLVVNPTTCQSGPDGTDCDPADLDLCFYMHTAMHEIMHVLGLYHNDQPGSTAVWVPGTPMSYDPGSVVNSGPSEFQAGNWCQPSCELSENDITALDFLYPPCDDCPTEGPNVEIDFNADNGMYCLVVNGEWFHDTSATYMYCPSDVSCYNCSEIPQVVSYTLCEWGTDSNCETGEGCCWDYQVTIPACDDNTDCIEPRIVYECTGNGLEACATINGLPASSSGWVLYPECNRGSVGQQMNVQVSKVSDPNCIFYPTVTLPDCRIAGGNNGRLN